MRRLLILVVMLVMVTQSRADEPVNYALHAVVTASSVYQEPYQPQKAIDNQVANDSRWLSEKSNGPHMITLDLGRKVEIGCLQLASGWKENDQWVDPVSNFRFEFWDGTQWRRIADASGQSNTQAGLQFIIKPAIQSDKIRLVINDDGIARVAEVRVLAPAASYESVMKSGPKPKPEYTTYFVFVNQSGYDLNGPKRFTAPLVEGEADFSVVEVKTNRAVYQGRVYKGLGDFSDFQPDNGEQEYCVVVSGGNLKTGQSDPFVIRPFMMEQASLEPALRFMVDCRSVIGTHPSAYGGSPWRDGTYYSYEVPSLILMYLANPAFFEHAPIEINYETDKAKFLADDFKLVRAPNDQDVMEATRRYFTELDPPVGDQVPDIMKLIHWGIGYYLMDPATRDPSSDPLPEQIHAQTVEQFAYFLYGYAYFKPYFSNAFYRQARDFAFEQWEKAGLFEVIETIGTYKGRHCPGHSIMPNLLMARVARREGREDAERFIQAAAAQTRWVIDQVDFNDPVTTKGQRMSEHKLMTGLILFLRDYPRQAPEGLRDKIKQWVDIMIARSDNMWDFRRYDDIEWTLPRFTAGSHGGAGWNEPGNVAAFPALCLATASVIDDPVKAHRLEEIAAGHWDDLFGRNPLGAHSAHRGPKDFWGVERGWPKKFPDNTCARLELVRGTISSTCATEHYPFDPTGDFRHPEGWTAFNAALNVGLAYTCQYDTKVEIVDPESGRRLDSLEPGQTVTIRVKAPVGFDGSVSVLPLVVESGRGEFRICNLAADREPGCYSGSVTFSTQGGENNDLIVIGGRRPIRLGYGYGFMMKSVMIIPERTGDQLRVVTR